MPQTNPSRVWRWLGAGGVLVLLLIQLTADIWTLPAFILTLTYLALLLVAWLRPSRLLIVALWLLLPLMVIATAYTAAGWALWWRGALVLLVMALPLVSHLAFPANVLLTAAALTLTLLTTYAADRAVGVIAGERKPGGLVFTRDSVVSYDTPEFSHTAIINTYGFRGRDADLNAPTACRVMLLGDSFTYGWGVDYPQTWGALLAAQLNANGLNATVYNLGIPGGNVPDYAAIAHSAAPLVRPDVVLVGVLQGDDIRQQSRPAGVFPRSLTFGEQVRPSPLSEYVIFHYPYIAERTILRTVSARSIRQTWANTAHAFLTDHTPARRARYETLPPAIRADFEAGRINPHFVQLAVVAPDYWVWVLDDPAGLRPYIDDMAAGLAAIRNAAPDAQTIVLSVPHPAYISESSRDALRELGFILPAEIIESAWVDGAVQQAAAGADLPFLAVTETFRTADDVLYYPVDGHMNAAGNRLFAESIYPTVAEACRTVE